MKHFVYGIKNTVTNKYYIGITNNYHSRFYRHIGELRRNKHHSKKLQCAFNKYGLDSFEFEILIELDCERDEILSLEKEYVVKYNSFENGYNMNLGGKENNGFSSKFNEEAILTICVVKERIGKSGGILSEIFETSRTSICRISKGKTQLDSYLKFKNLSEEEKNEIYENFLLNSSFNQNHCNNNKERILSKEDVFKILSFHKKYNKKEMLNKYFKCSQHTINLIIKKETYRDFCSEFDETKVDEILNDWKDIPSVINNFNRKLDEEIVLSILEDIDNKVSRKLICEKFKINTSTVDRLKKGTIYKDVLVKYENKKCVGTQ